MQRFIPLACWVTLASCTASDVSDSDPSDGNASSEGEGEGETGEGEGETGEGEGETGEGEGETGEGEGETGEGEGEGESPSLCTATAGTRLQLQHIAALDWVSSLIDPVAGSECRISDNVCMPTDVAYFSNTIYRTAPDGDFFVSADMAVPATPFWYYNLLLISTDFFTYESDTAYVKNAQDDPFSSTVSIDFHSARRLVAFDPVTFTTVVPAGQSERLQHQVLQGSDGTVLCADTLFDTQTQATCRPIMVDGETHKCMPIDYVDDQVTRFTDANCSEAISAFSWIDSQHSYGYSLFQDDGQSCLASARAYQLAPAVQLYGVDNDDICVDFYVAQPATLIALDTFADLERRTLDDGMLTRVAFVGADNVAVLSASLYDTQNDRPCVVEGGVCTSFPEGGGHGNTTNAYQAAWAFSDANCSVALYYSMAATCENHTLQIDNALYDAVPYVGETYRFVSDQCQPVAAGNDFPLYSPGAVLSVSQVIETPRNP